MALPELSIDNKGLRGKGYAQNIYHFFGKCSVFDFFVIIICLTSFGCSWIESVVNYDSLHWGFAYGSLLDLKRGAIPFSETFLGYGYIPALLGVIALSLFGEKLMIIGILTGLFYALTLFLSYLVFLRFLQKSFAFVAVLLIFLIHPYMIYPGGNYFAYTFQLLGLIFFLRYPDNRYNGFLAGFFLCMSVLSRYSSVIAILPPVVIMLGWELFTTRDTKKIIMEKIGIIVSGFLIPLALFFTYLFMNSALEDFFFQNKMMVQLWGRVDDFDTYLQFITSIFQIADSYASDFRGKLFTLILIVCLFVMIREVYRNKFSNFIMSDHAKYCFLTVCLVALFGYLNSIHHYETFRLINGSSIGVGVCVFVFIDFYRKTKKPLKYLMVFLSLFLFLFLSSSLLFKTTTSSYYPWRMDILLSNGVKNEKIGIFKGKILSKEYNDFYQEVYDAIVPYKDTCYIINYTNDGVAFLMNDLPRVQIASIYYPWFEDVHKQVDIINRNKALILSFKPLDLPGYTTILKKTWPYEIPWLGGGRLFIYVPDNMLPISSQLSR
jgi:hypothetical protein